MKRLSKFLGAILLFASLSACAAPTPAPTPIPTIAPTNTSIPDNSLHLGMWHDMFYHEGLGRIVLVNGGPESGKLGSDPLELWSWNGRQWSLLSSEEKGPRWRNYASIAYDSQRDVLVLYGGLTEERNYNDTWEWDGRNWTQFPVEGPGAREAAGTTFDTARNKVILFGGSQSGKLMNDIWEWDGNQWTQIPAQSSPEPRFPGGFVYDQTHQNVFLFGGRSVQDEKSITYSDTWIWNGLGWEKIAVNGPSKREGARAVFDSVFGHIVLFGGADASDKFKPLNDTWIWDGIEWLKLAGNAPIARAYPAMAYDPKRSVIVLTGGSNAPNIILNDTWEWNGENWACVSECK